MEDLGVDWECPDVFDDSQELRKAWERTCRSLPADAPDHCREMAVQVTRLMLREDEYHKALEGQVDLDGDKALRDTIKLRADIMKQIAIEGRQASAEQRRKLPTDPEPPKRSAGIGSLVRGSKDTVH